MNDLIEGDVIQDLSDVKEKKFLRPITYGLLVTIKNAEKFVKEKEGVWEWKCLKLKLSITDGIEVKDKDDNVEIKYKGSILYTDTFSIIDALAYMHNPEVKTSDWYSRRGYATEFKKFVIALGYDFKNPPVINDEFLNEIIGCELKVDLIHDPQKPWNEEKGDYVANGEFNEKLVNWAKAT